MLGLTADNSELIEFLCSTKGEQIMQENSMSNHLENGNFFYDNFNTQESFMIFYITNKIKINM